MNLPPKASLRQFAIFVGVGVASAAIDGGAFLALHHLGMAAWAANMIGFGLAFLANYHGNRILVFRAGQVRGALLRYVALVALNLATSTLLVQLGLLVGLTPWLAKGISMAIVALVNFVLLRLWVFAPRRSFPPGRSVI